MGRKEHKGPVMRGRPWKIVLYTWDVSGTYELIAAVVVCTGPA